jgi:hypothetical protein
MLGSAVLKEVFNNPFPWHVGQFFRASSSIWIENRSGSGVKASPRRPGSVILMPFDLIMASE